jgi:hypothetical protein
VAYEKTGQHAKAIETILAKEKITPGLYETYSNLGTFHILAGDFELGLPYIDKALAINPDAHFGRERYQKWLVEYAQEQRRDGKLTFPLRPHLKDGGFKFFLRHHGPKEKLTDAEFLQQAVKGVLGMMRFANHDNPLLLEALGDLLCDGSPSTDAKRLATRAYLKASYEVKEQAAQQGYRQLAEEALRLQTRHPQTHEQLTLAELEADFAEELADADKWYAKLKAKESDWIRNGKDADAEFERLYSEEPKALDKGTDFVVPTPDRIRTIAFGVGLWAVLLLLVVIGLRRIRGSTASANSERER